MKSHLDYIKEVAEIQPNLRIIGKYTGANNKIETQCKLCGNIWFPSANSIIRNNKCPNCHGLEMGHKDKRYFSNACPEFAKYLVNPIDGYRYKKMSNKKVDWICPNCNKKVEGISFNKIATRNHIPCKYCSDGISYPNKFMISMLTQINIEYVFEYSPKWIAPKRYDFYIPSRNLIIEMDGALGHGNKTIDGSTPDVSLKVDNYKDEMANKHGINVVRIDSLKSEKDYISQNIISSLSSYFDLSQVNWEKCETDALTSKLKEVCDLWNQTPDMALLENKTKLSRYTLIKYLKTGNSLGFCRYNAAKQMSKSGHSNIKKAYEANGKRVICLETMQVFKTCREAYKWLGYNIDGHSIQDNCRNKIQSAGKHPQTKQKLHWKFYKDYIDSIEKVG